MARVAIVTGGTRASARRCLALKEAGITVAANYAGNDERAREFTERTGIAAYKWDVADHDACQEAARRSPRIWGRSTSSSTMRASPATARS